MKNLNSYFPAIAIVILISLPTTIHAQGNYGKFVGKLVLQMHENGRDAELKDQFAYEDSVGAIWKVPKGASVNGASIPKPLWSFIGGPFSGKYRNASVIHDYYCGIKVKPWKSVHKVFYEAMLAGGVPVWKAKVMYGGVYTFGPRWGDDTSAAEYTPEKFDQLKKYIEKENPSLQEIESKAEKIIIEITKIETKGDKSPVLKDIKTEGDIKIEIK